MDQTYSVILFEDSSVEAVPSLWVKNGMCAYPPRSLQSSAIKNFAEPEDHWERHDNIEVLREGIGKYYKISPRIV